MSISPGRRAAFDVLMRVEEQDAYASEMLHSERFGSLSQEDHGLAQEITMGVLRWRSRLDAEIQLHSFTPLHKLDAAVLTALRIGAFQIRHLDRVPSHAAVHESVELVKSAGKASAAGLSNAVLRKIASGKSVRMPANLAEEFAHPQWLVDRWSTRFGEEAAREICNFDQQRPTTHLRIRGARELARTLASLLAEGIELTPGLAPGCWHVTGGDVTRTSAWKYRQIAIQDEGSQLVAHLAAASVEAPRRILDCCAAPGGKTMLLAEAFPEAKIVAAELHPHRVEVLKRLCDAPNVEIIQADATRFSFWDQEEEKFDLVLADVPCSGTGTLARNPEIKWRLRPQDLEGHAARQLAIASAALGQVKSGGVLVYSTCSMEREENELVIEKMLAGGGCEIVPAGMLLRKIMQQADDATDGDYLRTVPGRHKCDGFFAAVLRKL